MGRRSAAAAAEARRRAPPAHAPCRRLAPSIDFPHPSVAKPLTFRTVRSAAVRSNMPSRRARQLLAAAVLLTLVETSGAGQRAARRRRGELDPQTCTDNFDIQRDKIIRTEESREMGAKYLNELDVGAREECLRLCCETDTCDVFVFEEKSPGSCYLFNCGPPEDFKCKFTRHTNFSSGVLAMSRHLAELQDQVKLSKHEHDLASLRMQAASTSRPTTPMPPPPPPVATVPQRPSTPPPNPTRRRCSSYQFECHGSGECIAIYNACDGVPQCSDGSDEAAELGCPPIAPLVPAAPRTPPPPPPPPPRELPPVDQLTAQKVPVVDAAATYLRPASSDSAPPPPPRWPHRLVQAQPAALKPYQENSPSSHIFNHKGGLLQEGESQPQPQYMPYESAQESQWVRRPWQQPIPMEQLPMSDRQLMYRYGSEGARWQAPSALQAQPPPPPPQSLPSLQSGERAELGAGGGRLPDRDKMWAVPQAPVMKPEPPMYKAPKTMPEAPIMYSNQQETLRDSPKKGFDLGPKANKNPDSAYTQSVDKDNHSKSNVKDDTVNKEKIKVENKTNKKGLVEPSPAGPPEMPARENNAKEDKHNQHNVQHDHYKMVEDEHDGLSEKPPGAILLLILGVLMTTIMAVMLGCRLRVARRRMRRAGKSPFAHDADYLVNGMYL